MNPARLALLVLVAVATAFRLWFLGQGFWELSPEEAQYWDWSRRLDWNYYSKGPGIALLIALATRLAGDTALAVRLPAVIMGAFLPFLVFRLARETTGNHRTALWSVVLLTAMPLYAAGALLMTTDTPLLLCWTAALLAVWRAAEGRGARGWWHLAGAALAAGLLTKYTILLLVPCLLGFLFSYPQGRGALRGRGPGIVAGWGAVAAAPILLWNWRHDWVSLRHVAGQAARGSAPWWQSAGEFLGVQAGVISPLLFAGLVLGIGHAARRGLGRREPGPLLLFWGSGPILAFFLLWSLGAKVQGNWPAPAYLTAAIAAAAWAHRRLESPRARGKRRRKTLLAAGTASIILALIVQAGALAPRPVHALGRALVQIGEGAGAGAAGRPLQRVGRLLATGADPCKRLCGWRELADRVSATRAAMARESGGGPPFIVSDRYQLASLLAFYVEGQPRTFTANLGGRLTQYDIWGGLEGHRGRDGVFVTYLQPLPDPVRLAFRRVQVEPPLVVVRDGRTLHTFLIVRGFDFLGFPPPPGGFRY